MTDLITISEQIEKKIVEIDHIRSEIKQRGEEKARTAAVYDMVVAKTLMGLENGREYVIDGDTIKNPPKSIMEKLARGLAWEEKLRMDTAEANYKSIISNLEAVKSQLNALQSLNRNLE
jgi:hypothetical protein